eukprot:CAMPEP_0181536720 /NCGR_PEP_ID=MMETSP1110-20121109/74977_1 /TAXON_ID=174948 /ORGANISM="Symbiodinium sp., Strain CCMP421" /LENGTH=116 /DNA_ID=CAMNT_0023668261 /DNA_START=271 /DNA_END=620 /DNA_ORIENTATION=+
MSWVFVANIPPALGGEHGKAHLRVAQRSEAVEIAGSSQKLDIPQATLGMPKPNTPIGEAAPLWTMAQGVVDTPWSAEAHRQLPGAATGRKTLTPETATGDATTLARVPLALTRFAR